MVLGKDQVEISGFHLEYRDKISRKMKRELKVNEFNKKQDLLDFVNKNSNRLDILSISTCQVGTYYGHFLWYYKE